MQRCNGKSISCGHAFPSWAFGLQPKNLCCQDMQEAYWPCKCWVVYVVGGRQALSNARTSTTVSSSLVLWARTASQNRYHCLMITEKIGAAAQDGWHIGARPWQIPARKIWQKPSKRSWSMAMGLEAWICTWHMEGPILDFGLVRQPWCIQAAWRHRHAFKHIWLYTGYPHPVSS